MTLFDTETHEVVGDHQAPGPAFAIAFDPQGDSLAVAEDTSATGTLEILDAATGRVRSSTSLAAGQGFAHFGVVIYAPDGRSLFVPYSRGDSLFLRRYDARRGTPLGKPVRVAPQLDTPPLMTPDGRLLVSTDRGIYAIDAETLRVIRRYPVSGVAALSPDGRTAAIEAADGGLRLLDLASGRVRTLSRQGRSSPSLQPRRAYPLDRRGQWERDPVGRREGGPDRNPRGPRGHTTSSTPSALTDAPCIRPATTAA